MSEVSIIIAVYNGERYLSEAIESALDQSYPNLEVVVVDDGSQDNTKKIAAIFGSRVRYIFQENRGQPAAQNLGISITKSPFLSFLDADDLYSKEKTALQMAFLKKEPTVDFVLGHVEQFKSPEIAVEASKRWFCPQGIAPGYLAASALFRRECFNKVGLFNEEQRIGVFIDWYMRAEEKGLKRELISDLVLRRRIHENNMGIHSQNDRSQYLEIVKNALKRRALCRESI